MGLFGFGRKKKDDWRDQEIKRLKKENQRLKDRHLAKDGYFAELMSDGLRHGSSLAGKHMADRKKYLNGK